MIPYVDQNLRDCAVERYFNNISIHKDPEQLPTSLQPGAYIGLERAGHRPKALHRRAQGRAGADHPLADGRGWGDGGRKPWEVR